MKNAKKIGQFIAIILVLILFGGAGVAFAETDNLDVNTSGNESECDYVVYEGVGEDGNPVRVTTDVSSREEFNQVDVGGESESDEDSFYSIIIRLMTNVYYNGSMSYDESYSPNSTVTAEGRSSFGFCVEPGNSSTASGDYSTSTCSDPLTCAILYYGYAGEGAIWSNTAEDWRDTWWTLRRAYLGDVSSYRWNERCQQLWDYASSHPLPSGSYCVVFTHPTEQDLIGCLYKAPEAGNLSFQKYDTSGNALSGGKYHLTGDGVDMNITSPQTVTGLKPGSYTVTETAAPDGYYCSGQSTSVTVSAGSTVTATLDNKLLGKLKFIKYDESGNELSGGLFHVTGPGVDTYITAGETVTGLAPGDYTVTEVTAPVGYVLENQTTTEHVEPDQVITATLTDKEQRASIRIMKYDYETSKVTQGDATLQGAVFEIHQGTAAGPVVGTLTTDADGNTGTISDLPLDNYYAIETTAPVGYRLDTTPIYIDKTWKESTQTKDVLDDVTNIKDKVIKGKVHIQKYYHDTGSVLTQLSGIEYTLTLNSDTSKVYSEKTDNKGELTFTDIPYGVYTLHEVESTLPAHVTHMDDRTVTILEHDKQLDYYVNDDRVRAEVTVMKKDSEDGSLVAVSGAGFKVIDLNGTTNAFLEQTRGKKKVNEWYTDDSGTLVFDEAIPSGDYALIESTAPNGYYKFTGSQSFVVDTTTYYGVKFTVNNDTATKVAEGQSYVMTVEISNEPSRGRIDLYKTGETLTGSHTETVTVGKTYTTTTFEYGQTALAGATFEVRAAEDIVGQPTIAADKLSEAIQNLPDKDDPLYSVQMVVWKAKYLTDRVYYHKGDLVETIVTGANGKCQTGDLYLGKYTVTEVGAPTGYTIDSTPMTIELNYQGQEVKADANIGNLSMADTKQNAEIKVNEKQMEEITGYAQDGEKVRQAKSTVKATGGIYFGLYTNQDIVTTAGNVVATKDTLIEVVEVQSDGTAKTTKNIPIGNYYLKEVSTQRTLAKSSTKYPVTYTAQGNQNILTVAVNNGKAVVNKTVNSSFELSKKSLSIYGGELIPGCSYKITTEDGKEIFKGTTNANGVIVIPVGTDSTGDYGLGVGKYYLEEYAAPQGVKIDHTKYEFEVKKNSDDDVVLSTTSTKEDQMIMGDINIEKEGEDTVNISVENTTDSDGQTKYEMVPLAGAKFAIRAAEDIIPATGIAKAYKGDIVAFCTTDSEGKATPTEYFFMNSEMAAERGSDKTARDLTKSTDSRILKESHAFLGNYEVYEVEVPDKYRLDTNVYKATLDCSDNETELVSTTVEIDNYCKKGDVEITKTDIATDETIANTSIRIYRDGKVIFEGKTDTNGDVTLKALPIGKYSYQEYDAPDGVLVDDGIVDFEIKDGEVTKATIKDELTVGILEITKTGEDTIHYTVDENGQTHYVQIPVAGIKFKAVASEDIVSPTGVVKAKKGDTVGYVTTDANGKAKFTDCKFMTQAESKARTDSMAQDLTKTATQSYGGLYLGKYKIYEVETTALYRLSEEVHDVEISFTEPVKYINVGNSWENYCKKGDVEITKTDVATDETLPNCGIRIWDDRGIIFEGYTDGNGKIVLKDLPIGKYRYQEYDAPKGTLINEDIYDFEITDYGVTKANIQDKVALSLAKIIKRGEDRENWKIDETGMTKYEQKALEGVKFELIAAEDIVSPSGVIKAKKGDIVAYTETDENGKASFDECYFMTQAYSDDRSVDIEEDLTKVDPEGTKESERKTQTFAGAYFGKYIIKEVEKVEDYRLNETEYEIELKYQDDKTAIVEAESVLIDNESEKGDVFIHKTDVSTGAALPNTGVRIYDEEKNIIFEGRTDANGDITITLLPTGKYSYQEYDAPEGYQINESLFDFEIKDGEVTKCGMTNELIPDTGISGGIATLIVVVAMVLIAAVIIVLRIKAKK